jgi:phage-related protein
MTFNRRDSIGRSDVYHNPYDIRHISNPAMNKSRAEGFQDTMSSQERDILRQLQEGLKVPEGALFYVLYAGKGLFYVMIVPAYFLLFSAPKWMLMQGGPYVMQMIMKAARHFNEQFNMAMLHRIQEIARKIAARLEKMGRGFNEVYTFAGEMLQKGKHFSENMLKAMKEYIQKMGDIYQAMTEPFRKAAAMAKKGSEWVQEAASNLVEGMQNLYRNAVETVLSPFKAAAEAYKNAREFVKNIGKNLVEALEKYVFNPVETAKNFVSDLAKKLREKIANAVEKRVLEPTRKIAEKIKNITESVTDFAKENVNKLTHAVKEIGHRTVELYQKAAENIPHFARGVVEGLVSVMPQPIVNFFVPVAMVAGALWRSPRHIKSAGKSLVVKMRQLKDWTKSTAKWIVAKVKQGVQNLKKGIVWAFDQMMKVPSLLWNFFGAFISIAYEAVKRLFSLFKLLMTWIKVLFKFGMMQIKAKA